MRLCTAVSRTAVCVKCLKNVRELAHLKVVKCQTRSALTSLVDHLEKKYFFCLKYKSLLFIEIM